MFEEGDRLKSLYGKENVYDFTLGNPYGEPPQRFQKVLSELVLSPIAGMHCYMPNEGLIETREVIAQTLKEDSGMDFTHEHIIMTCGAAGALNVVLKTLLNPGKEVIVFSPFFMEYRFYIDNHNGICRQIPTKENFDLDLEVLDSAITERTKAIILNSPNNPTGIVYGEESLQDLKTLVEERQKSYETTIYLIVDEAYKRIVYDGLKPPNIFSVADNVISVTSYSKDLAIPGERIGYIAISPKVKYLSELVAGLAFSNRILGFVNAPSLMQRVIRYLPRVSVDVWEYQEKRDFLYENLRNMGYQMIKPQGAFYLFPRSPLPDDIAFVRKAAERNLLLVPGSGFGTPGYFRISYSVEKRVIEGSLPIFERLALECGLKKDD